MILPPLFRFAPTLALPLLTSAFIDAVHRGRNRQLRRRDGPGKIACFGGTGFAPCKRQVLLPFARYPWRAVGKDMAAALRSAAVAVRGWAAQSFRIVAVGCRASLPKMRVS